MHNLKKPIVLIGLSGSGKTTIGQLLAKKLSLKFIDTDQIISKKFNCSIDNIFTKYGEEFFRKQESIILQDLILNKDNYILSTGGGIITTPKNLALLLEHFIVIHVICDINIIAKRLETDDSRPLTKGNCLEKLNFLFTQRQNLYNKAHISIDTSSNDIDQIIKESINKLNNFNET